MSDRTTLDLSIVIPAWNERANLELLVPALRQVCEDVGIRAEVVVIDAGPRDGTADLARRLGARVVPRSVSGYGRPWEGFAMSRGGFRRDHGRRPLAPAGLPRRPGKEPG